MDQLVSSETIESYFADIVQKTVQRRRVFVTDDAQFYIVNLLCQFALTDRLYKLDEESGQKDRDALALLLARAQNSPTYESMKLLRELGDSSLYISGYFAESLARSLVDVDYYISMGGNAYGTLSGVLRYRQQKGQSAVLYAELAEKFRDLVDILARVSQQSSFSFNNESLLKLYDLWVRTGSQRVADKLRANGLDPGTIVADPDGEQ